MSRSETSRLTADLSLRKQIFALLISASEKPALTDDFAYGNHCLVGVLLGSGAALLTTDDLVFVKAIQIKISASENTALINNDVRLGKHFVDH